MAELVVALPNGEAVVAPPNKVGADEVVVPSDPKDRVGCEVGAEVAGVVDPNKLLL